MNTREAILNIYDAEVFTNDIEQFHFIMELLRYIHHERTGGKVNYHDSGNKTHIEITYSEDDSSCLYSYDQIIMMARFRLFLDNQNNNLDNIHMLKTALSKCKDYETKMILENDLKEIEYEKRV